MALPRSSRVLLLAMALTLVSGACTGGEDPSPSPEPTVSGPEGSLAALQASADVELSMLQAQSELTTERNVFTFGLSSGPGALITEGTPQVYLARSMDEPALGPFPAQWHEFTGYALTGDTSPMLLPGFYATEVEIPEPGNWLVAATADVEGGIGFGVGATEVVAADDAIAAIGSEALSVETPVATKPAAARRICTREPRPDPLHYISLDDALTNGKPTVVNFGTPLLCSSQMCGPVVDEVQLVFEGLGPQRANFVHVEVFPTRDLDAPAQPFTDWGFESEPWTLVIDADGIIRARFEGPVSEALIEEELQALL